ncbi:hypothetical protein N0V82_008832 [Gnomoniopsis sp. IMI 355080]|nr:hypothetical protein N0V82_008832 [Gnomoniopsis sp. IMI 355080]
MSIVPSATCITLITNLINLKKKKTNTEIITSINIDQVTNLTAELSQGAKLLAEGNDKARLRLWHIAHKLSQVLETPQETFYRLWMVDSVTRTVVQVASDIKLPENLPDEPDKAVGSAELAEKTGAEQALLSEWRVFESLKFLSCFFV